MSIASKLKDRVKKVINKFSGEYSAAETEIRPDTGASSAKSGDVKVTRARLKRPPGEPEN